ncbi:hypothetical protein FKM82_003907 [Ascaphus truei]
MASAMLAVRSLAVSGLSCLGGPRWAQIRGYKRWLRPYLRALQKQRELDGDPEPEPRSKQPNFDYHAEVVAFAQRLSENFSVELLKTAFVNGSYVTQEESRRRNLGLDKEAAALSLADNKGLSDQGSDFTASCLREILEDAFQKLPMTGITALVDYLTSEEVLCHVAQNLAVEDLTLSSECPLSPVTLQRTFYAVIGALLQSSGPQRAGLFIRDFLIPQLVGKDLFDVWSVADPMSMLVEELSKRNVALPEPRLTRHSGASTVLPVYFVGLYCDKNLIAEGPGQSVDAAEEEAARVALRRMFGFTENRRPWEYSAHGHETREKKALSSS